jgi:hypothetical protein
MKTNTDPAIYLCDTVGHQDVQVYHHVQIDGAERPVDLCDSCLAGGLATLLDRLTIDEQKVWLKEILSG